MSDKLKCVSIRTGEYFINLLHVATHIKITLLSSLSLSVKDLLISSFFHESFRVSHQSFSKCMVIYKVEALHTF